MSAYNNAMSRQNAMGSSSMFYSNSTGSPHNNGSYQSNPFTMNRQSVQYSSSEVPTHLAVKASVHQSAIYAPRTEVKPKVGGLGKLDSMARQVVTTNKDVPLQKHNSSEKAPFSRGAISRLDDNPYNSTILAPKPFYSYGNMEEQKKMSHEGCEEEPKRRRESVDLDAMTRKGGQVTQKFRNMQRTKTFHPMQFNPSQIQKNDLESTNSGSGNELLKPKQFDFSKRKLEMKDDSGTNTPLIKNFQSLKKSDQMWPLSISPIEQKIPKCFEEENVPYSPTSATKSQSNQAYLEHGQSALNSIQFKKKKFVDARPQSHLPSQTQQISSTRPQQQTRFNPMKPSVCQTKPIQKQQAGSVRTRASPKPLKQFSMNDFDIINKLGKGAFGQVFMAQQKLLGWICVIKKMSMKRIRQGKVEQHIIRQIKLQSYLNHSHLTALYGFFHDEEYLYLILECLPDGSLQQVKKKKKIPEKQTADIVRQVAVGLKYMHQEYVIHRDLKPENLFVNDGYVKIGDFGCSIYHNATGLRKTLVGCLEYSSPEQLSQEGYTDKIDAWSVGIMTYELLFGKSPFESDIKKMVMGGQSKTELSQVNFPSAPVVGEETKQFILNLLNRNPDQRMDMDEVLFHPFLKE